MSVVEGDVEVGWSAFDGTAIAGTDYSAASGDVTLNLAQRTAEIVVGILNDDTNETTEQFTVSLTGASGATLDVPTTALVTIEDDDDPSSLLSLTAGSYQISEGGGSVEIIVQADPPASSEVTARLRTTPGSAIGGLDYLPLDELLIFGIGEFSKSRVRRLPGVGDGACRTRRAFQCVCRDRPERRAADSVFPRCGIWGIRGNRRGCHPRAALRTKWDRCIG
jgi:hypothetical protein